MTIESDTDSPVSFPFSDTVTLQPNTEYEIIYEMSFHRRCSFDNIFIGSSSSGRRLLSDDSAFSYSTFKANSNPSACTMGKNLATSKAMKASVESMCMLYIYL